MLKMADLAEGARGLEMWFLSGADFDAGGLGLSAPGDQEIMIRIQRVKQDLEIVMSIPGMGLTSAITVLAEIGNYKDFENGDKLGS